MIKKIYVNPYFYNDYVNLKIYPEFDINLINSILDFYRNCHSNISSFSIKFRNFDNRFIIQYDTDELVQNGILFSEVYMANPDSERKYQYIIKDILYYVSATYNLCY